MPIIGPFGECVKVGLENVLVIWGVDLSIEEGVISEKPNLRRDSFGEVVYIAQKEQGTKDSALGDSRTDQALI